MGCSRIGVGALVVWLSLGGCGESAVPTAPYLPLEGGGGDGSSDVDAGPSGGTGDAGPAGDGAASDMDGGLTAAEDSGATDPGGDPDGGGTSGDGDDSEGEGCTGTDEPVTGPKDCSANTGTTTGVVRDLLTGAAISGVTIRSASCPDEMVTSGGDGAFSITTHNDGDYLRLEKSGLAKGLSVYITAALDGLDVRMVAASAVSALRTGCATRPLALLKIEGAGRSGITATPMLPDEGEAVTYLNASLAAKGDATSSDGLARITGSAVPGATQFLGLPETCTPTTMLPLESDRVAIDSVTCD